MIDKTNGYSPKPMEENDIEVPNFKLLYRNTPNPEGDKSSGVSSDEETTSSSLIPIPDTLRQMRKKLKKTMSDVKEYPEAESPFNVSEVLENPAEKVRNSLEELRKKYTLQNETSVTLKVNSANLILDDILNSTNMNNENTQYRLFKDQPFRPKSTSENETSTTETSLTKHCSHVLDHPVAFDFYTSCPRHACFNQPLHNHSATAERGGQFLPENSPDNPDKKTLIKKFQDLQIKGKIQSVYRSLQKTRNPFAKSKKEEESMKVPQGIPGGDYHSDVAIESETSCKCRSGNYHPSKKISLDLVENSEMSQSETRSTSGDERYCTCLRRRDCSCPEVIPKCICVEETCQSTKIASENFKHNSQDPEFLKRNKECSLEGQSKCTSLQKCEAESNLSFPNNDEEEKKKAESFPKNCKGTRRHCTRERRLIERTDIYYFDHGNSAYYRTTDTHPLRYTECLVERTDHYATKFWAEFFGSIEIGIAFLISFILQLYRFLFTSIIRSLIVGLLQISSDYFFKPVLTIIFNGIIQPCLILAYNIATSVRDLCLPISQIFGFFGKELAGILRSCRVVEFNREKQISCNCGNKV